LAKRKTKKKTPAKRARSNDTQPKFPYTTTPGALRTFLKLVPQKPKPEKVNNDHLKSWGIADSNANTVIRVLKSLDFVTSTNVVMDHYISFMQPAIGPAVLGDRIREVYAPFFQASHEPFKESDEEITRLFHIHSSGSEGTLKHQVQTFKALCEFATFGGTPTVAPAVHTGTVNGGAATQQNPPPQTPSSTPSVHIDLHIHLPENKSTRDYQAIIEDIARYIYRHEDVGDE